MGFDGAPVVGPPEVPDPDTTDRDHGEPVKL